MTEQEQTRYIVIVHAKDTAPSRLAKLVPALQDALAGLSTVQPELAFRSLMADYFGFFIKSKLVPAQIVAAIESPGRGYLNVPEPILGGGDALFVIELGQKFMGTVGFTRASTWLQRH